MLQSLISLMAHTIQVAPYVSQNAYGEATYSADVAYTARVQGKMRMVRDSQGVERVSTATCYIATTATISPKDRITLPNGFLPTNPPILAVERQADERGDHHVVIYV